MNHSRMIEQHGLMLRNPADFPALLIAAERRSIKSSTTSTSPGINYARPYKVILDWRAIAQEHIGPFDMAKLPFRSMKLKY